MESENSGQKESAWKISAIHDLARELGLSDSSFLDRNQQIALKYSHFASASRNDNNNFYRTLFMGLVLASLTQQGANDLVQKLSALLSSKALQLDVCDDTSLPLKHESRAESEKVFSDWLAGLCTTYKV